MYKETREQQFMELEVVELMSLCAHSVANSIG